MERKIRKYKEWLQRENIEVKTMEWIIKKTWTRGSRGYTEEASQHIKIEFVGEMPDYIFLGSERFEVHPYVEEVIQCFNCQKTGHIAKNCKSITVCGFCSKKGHRKSDKVCRTSVPCCANCQGSHPTSYRGCVSFKREKLAKNIQAKDRTSIFEARKLASKKHFPALTVINQPQVTNSPSRPQHSSYANAVSPHRSTANALVNPATHAAMTESSAISNPHAQISSDNSNLQPTSTAPIRNEPSDDFINNLVNKILKETLSKIFSKFTTLLLNVIHATSIDTKGKSDIVSTGIDSIIRQFIPDDTDVAGNDMSYIEDWLTGNETEQEAEDLPQAKKKTRTTRTARYIKHKGKGKKTKKYGK